MIDKNKYKIKSADGILLKVGQKVWRRGVELTIEGFGEGLYRGGVYAKGLTENLYGSILYSDKNLSIKQCLDKAFLRVKHEMNQHLEILRKEIEEIKNLLN